MEERWRAAWDEEGVYRTPLPSDRPRMYVLDFFPYPSGEGLSVGHARNYVPTDVLSRYYRMRGYAVLHPMGWDAFGLPAENEALLRGRHPRDTTREYGATYKRQLRLLGCSYDWDREITTSDPAYYRWTQWAFLLLLRAGLAYRALGRQWWCPECGTILANEQVQDGRCWRHASTPVERRVLTQWYVRTTVYADRLLADLEGLDWPESIKAMQRNWIGRSEGIELTVRLFPRPESPPARDGHRVSAAGGGARDDAEGETLTVFAADTRALAALAGLALAPEHPQAAGMATSERRATVEAYVRNALTRKDTERSVAHEASGVWTGRHARHPLTGEPVPIYVNQSVLADQGAVPISGIAEAPRDGRGRTTRDGDPGAVPGDVPGAVPAVRYRMRDWLVSRQRYWGAPIPIIYCDRCGVVPVPDDDLPVRLPEVDRYAPAGTGRSPLDGIAEFVLTRCPACGGPGRRETDTLDGFVDSCWYFLRFADPGATGEPWSPVAARYWLPVDWYVGGAEHAVMHLLYARFFTKVLSDHGLAHFTEPFVRLRNQGSMLSPRDGARMAKSRGNVITPDEVTEQYGADAVRVYTLFIGPFDQDVTWDPAGMVGAARFVGRMRRLMERGIAAIEETTAVPARNAAEAPAGSPAPSDPPGEDEAALRGAITTLSRSAAGAIEGFRFNVLVADLMSFLNRAERAERRWGRTPLWREILETLLCLCAPLMPFLAEEYWRRMGHATSVHLAAWPAPGAAARVPQSEQITVQVDGRTRDRLEVPPAAGEDEIVRLAVDRPRVARAVGGRAIARVVLVPGRLVNLVLAAPTQPDSEPR